MKMNIPCKTIRAMAWAACKSSYWVCLGITVIGTILTNALSLLVSVFTTNQFVSAVVSVIEFVLQVAVSLGLARFFLNIFRGQKANFDTFTEGFTNLGKAVVMEVIATLKTFLWSLLFVIPGIVYALGNAQMYRIMADNPDLQPHECINRSQAMMKGNKMKLVKLYLSYFGWFLLAELPAQIYQSVYGPQTPTFSLDVTISDYTELAEIFNDYLAELSDFNNQPIMILLSLLSIFATVYLVMGETCFYDLLSGNLVVTNNPDSI